MFEMISAASTAFNDPDSPIYYVVGALFLAALIIALVVYITVSKKLEKKRKAKEESEEAVNSENKKTETDATENEVAKTDEGVAKENATTPDTGSESENKEKAASADGTEKTEEKEKAEEKIPEEEPVTANAEESKEPVPVELENREAVAEPEIGNPEFEEKSDNADLKVAPDDVKQTVAEAKEDRIKTAETQEKVESIKPAAPKRGKVVKVDVPKKEKKVAPAAAPTEKPAPAQATEVAKPKSTVKKSAAKTPAKTFIDRIIEDKSTHAVYNEIKNAVLSYPGMKAKLATDGEQFVFDGEAKAKIKYDGGKFVLYLAVDPANIPSQFKVSKSVGAFPTRYIVSELEIDSAIRLIIFAMNVSMLVRNDKHRRVDYVKKAVEAKSRAAAPKEQ